VPFGSMTMVGRMAGVRLLHGLVVDIKCPVQPVLAMPSVAGDWRWLCVAWGTGLVLRFICELTYCALLHGGCHVHLIFCHSLPPIWLAQVAAVLCPSRCFVHVALVWSLAT
jgi:hypothetical protein